MLSSRRPLRSPLIWWLLSCMKLSGVKWVADFRDYWTSSTIEDSYKDDSAMITRARTAMKHISEASSAITAVNGSVGKYVGATQVISNGFDPAIAALWESPSKSDMFLIGLLGTFEPWNPIEPLFKVLECVRKVSPREFDRIGLVQVGNIRAEQFLALASKYGMGDRCRLHGLQPRTSTVGLLQESICFYQSLQLGWGRGIISARIFDLIASGRPILAYTDSGGEIDRLVRSTGNGFCFSDEKIESAADYLLGLMAAQETNTLKIVPRPPYAEPFRWEQIAGQFTGLFESLL